MKKPEAAMADETLPPDEQARILAMVKKTTHTKPKKDRRITIRLYSEDVEKIKVLAAAEGLPYQTYITSVLHKLANGHNLQQIAVS